MKVKVNYFLFWLLLLSFLSLLITALIKFPGLLMFLGIRTRGLPMYEINLIHDWSGVVLSVLILIHIILHWKWIINITKQIFKSSKDKDA